MKRTIAQTAGLGWLMSCLLATAPAEAAVSVHGGASSSGENITVQIFADITSPAIVSYCFKVFYDPASLRVVSASRNDNVWYFFDGTSRVGYMNPDTSKPGEVLFVGGKMDARNATQGVVGEDVLLGTIIFARQNPKTPSFSISIGREGQYANFVTTEGTTLDAKPGEVSFNGVAADPNDRDLDGLGDRWEQRYFGRTDRAYYSDDSDRDGVNNLAEEALGSDPTDAGSNLRLIIHRGRGGVMLEWASAEGRSYAVEASDDLRKFRSVRTDLKATPPFNQLALEGSEAKEGTFYRVRLQSSSVR